MRAAFDKNIPLNSNPPPGILESDLVWDRSLQMFWSSNHLLSFRYGACIPSSCSRDDFEQLINYRELMAECVSSKTNHFHPLPANSDRNSGHGSRCSFMSTGAHRRNRYSAVGDLVSLLIERKCCVHREQGSQARERKTFSDVNETAGSEAFHSIETLLTLCCSFPSFHENSCIFGVILFIAAVGTSVEYILAMKGVPVGQLDSGKRTPTVK